MKKIQYLLGIETSCDDCAVAIINSKGRVLAETVNSQTRHHSKFGGIVPEIASRHHAARLNNTLLHVLKACSMQVKDIDIIVVTHKPGLISSLLVGVQFAKGLSQSLRIPVLAVNHIEGHLLVGFKQPNFPLIPFIGLIASGGHSGLYLYKIKHEITLIGTTRDDAAGEALDKIGRLLGLPYPAGVYIDKLSQPASPKYFIFPMALEKQVTLDFSFSGLKTAAKTAIEKKIKNQQDLANFCASIQDSISNALLKKAMLACQKYNVYNLVLGGGVAANTKLRHATIILSLMYSLNLYLPEKKYCSDNAVMIARAGLNFSKIHKKHTLDFHVESN